MVLIDDDFNTVSLRIFNAGSVQGEYTVCVKEVAYVGEMENSLFKRVKGLVDPDADPWKSFYEWSHGRYRYKRAEPSCQDKA